MRRWANGLTVERQAPQANAYDPPATTTYGPYPAVVTPADERTVYYSELRGQRVTHVAVLDAGANIQTGDRATVAGTSYLVREVREAGRRMTVMLEVRQ